VIDPAVTPPVVLVDLADPGHDEADLRDEMTDESNTQTVGPYRSVVIQADVGCTPWLTGPCWRSLRGGGGRPPTTPRPRRAGCSRRPPEAGAQVAGLDQGDVLDDPQQVGA
jgi:hypothetical protein